MGRSGPDHPVSAGDPAAAGKGGQPEHPPAADFQPEQQSSELERAIDQTVAACTDMAKTRTGVLIVFERKLLLDDIVRSGTTLDAAVSSELLKNIFS